ncbi:MAG: PAS domain-containing protein, partial [Acidobacteria bacterium]|nr:PAS domain-containing protein [Acidobacteriota bacterium]
MIRQPSEHAAMLETMRRELERFAYATLDALSEHVAVVDAQGTVIAVNRAWREFAGANALSLEGLGEGANYFAACESAKGTGAEGATRFADGLRAVINGELDEFSLEYPCHSPTHQRWFIARATRVEFEGEIRVVVTHANITARKLAENSLKQLSNEVERQLHTFDAVVSSVQDFIYMFDLEGRFTYINKPLLDLWQKTFEQAVGKNFYDLDYPPDLAKRLQGQIQEVITSRRPLKDETPYTSASGMRAYEYILVPLISDGGAVEAVSGVTRDITERKRAENALRESEEWLRAIFEASRDGILVEDDEHIAYVNRAYARLFGYED